jgi:hypothetical protein
MKRSRLLILIILVYGATAAIFWITSVNTVTIYPDKDSYSWQSIPKANNGHSDNFEITSFNQPPYNMRGWIEFNTTSIPSNAWVTSAKLRLRVWHISKPEDPFPNTGDSTGRIYGVFRITQPWTETGVNWVNQPNYTEENHATALVPSGQGGWYGPLLWMEWDITNIVKDWQSGNNNNGLVVKDTQENASTFYTTQFFTHDQVPNKGYYPRLVVNYLSPLNLAIFGGILIGETVFILAIPRLRLTHSSKPL